MNNDIFGVVLMWCDFFIVFGVLVGVGMLFFGMQGNVFVVFGKLVYLIWGMVISLYSFVSEVGLEVFKCGGIVVEVLIVVGFILCVIYLYFIGFGGDVFWVLSDKVGNVYIIFGIGQVVM